MTNTTRRIDGSGGCDVIRVMPYDRVIVVPGPRPAKPPDHANHWPLLGTLRTVDLGPSCCDVEGHPGDLWSAFSWLSCGDNTIVARMTAEKVRNWRWALGGKRGSDRRDAEDDAELRDASMEFVRMAGLHGRRLLDGQDGWDGMLSDRVDNALGELFDGPAERGALAARGDAGPSYVARPNRATARGVRSFLSAVSDFLFVHSTGSRDEFTLLRELLWTVLDSDVALAALSLPGRERDAMWRVVGGLMVSHCPSIHEDGVPGARVEVLRRLYDAAMGSKGDGE